MELNDAHCHFFSQAFFERLAREAGTASRADDAGDVTGRLGWDPPGDAAALADRWATEFDRHGVARAVLIASVPGDEESVAAACARHPARFVGFFMLDPTREDAAERVGRARARGLRGVCLFPAMHHFRPDEERVLRVCEAAAATPGAAVFVHCGVLSVGVRRRLGLPSRFDFQLGNPLAVQAAASAFPHLPFIIPHFGAGFFREALMAADACPNVYFDTSSSNGWIRYHPGLTLPGVFRQALEVIGPGRLLFGTDSSFFPRGWQRSVRDGQAEALDALGVDGTARQWIFGGNFARLFDGSPGLHT